MAGERRRLRYHLQIEVPSAMDEQLTESLSNSDAAGLPGEAARSPLRLLVVDDESDLRNIIVRLLKRRNHKVDAAGDGDEAWGNCKAKPTIASSSICACLGPAAKNYSND